MMGKYTRRWAIMGAYRLAELELSVEIARGSRYKRPHLPLWVRLTDIRVVGVIKLVNIVGWMPTPPKDKID